MVSDAEKATMLAAIEKQAMEYAKSKGVNITPNVEVLIHKKAVETLDLMLKAMRL